MNRLIYQKRAKNPKSYSAWKKPYEHETQYTTKAFEQLRVVNPYRYKNVTHDKNKAYNFMTIKILKLRFGRWQIGLVKLFQIAGRHN